MIVRMRRRSREPNPNRSPNPEPEPKKTQMSRIVLVATMALTELAGSDVPFALGASAPTRD
jgi:hypothetical protein